MTDVRLLNEMIEASGLRARFIAEKLGLSAQGYYNKINGKSEFTLSEVKTLCDLLNITSLRTKEQVFFASDVSDTATEQG